MHSRRLRAAAASLTILAGTLLPSTSSHAFITGFVAYLGFDVEAGLDTATRDFLNAYPEKIKEQAVTGSAQIMDRADESVSRIFAQGRDLLLLGKDVINCAEVTAERLPRGVLDRLFGFRPNYTEMIQDELEQIADESRLTSKPIDLLTRYIDADNIGKDAYCLTLQGDLDHHSVLLIRAELKTKWLLWKRMEALKPTPANPVGCTSVRECYALVSTTVDAEMGKSLKQDKDLIKAEHRMSMVVRPPEPNSSWFSNNFDLSTYEQAMLIMLSVHDDLIRARVTRETIGTQKLERLRQLINSNEAKIQNAELERNRAAACNQAYKAAGSLREASELLLSVRSYEVLPQEELDMMANKNADLERRRIQLSSVRGNGIINDNHACMNEREEREPRIPWNGR